MVSCTTVRDLLTEHALGVAGTRESAIVDRHLAWCAACRKESQDLERAAATLAFALAPAGPPADLGDRVVDDVQALSGRRGRIPAGPRRVRRAGVVALAAAIALSGLGVGAVIARRSTPDEQAAVAAQRVKDAAEGLGDLFERAALFDPESDVLLGMLRPDVSGRGSGSALTIAVPSVDDRSVVMIAGLADRAGSLPYRITLADGEGHVVLLGAVTQLDSGGGATIARVTGRDLTSYVNVLVTDAHDRVVLRGTLRERTSVPSPAP